MSTTTTVSRGICAALQPLMGPQATGQILVKSTGATGTLPARAFALPILRGGISEEGMAFVTPNPATADGSWPVTSAGVAVTVEAILGGPAGNTPAGTGYRWDPPASGIEAVSTSTAGLGGGSLLGGLGNLRAVRLYKQLGQPTLEQLFRAQAFDFPAAILGWERTQPWGGAMGSSPGPRTGRTARMDLAYRHSWLLWLITSRLDTDEQRRVEGDELRDAVMGRLHQRQKARGIRVSMEPGAEILDASVFAVTPTSYVDLIRFGTTATFRFQTDEQFNAWLKTRFHVQTPEQPPGVKIDIPDDTVLMS